MGIPREMFEGYFADKYSTNFDFGAVQRDSNCHERILFLLPHFLKPPSM
jgi:hypothetical protein